MQKSPQRERTRGYSLWGDCVSNHLKIFQRIPYCRFLLRRTLGLLSIFVFRFIVILSLDDAELPFMKSECVYRLAVPMSLENAMTHSQWLEGCVCYIVLV